MTSCTNTHNALSTHTPELFNQITIFDTYVSVHLKSIPHGTRKKTQNKVVYIYYKILAHLRYVLLNWLLQQSKARKNVIFQHFIRQNLVVDSQNSFKKHANIPCRRIRCSASQKEHTTSSYDNNKSSSKSRPQNVLIVNRYFQPFQTKSSSMAQRHL